MPISDEPVRGDIPPKGFNGYPGVDRARAFTRANVPYPPLAHLVGIRWTQQGPGSAVVAMPATPWLRHTSGASSLIMLMEGAGDAAAYTLAEPWQLTQPRTFNYSQVRLISSRSTSFVSRAEVIRTAGRMAFFRATAEDSQGRLIAQGTGSVDYLGRDGQTFVVRVPPR